jgi:hypothetical protein
MSFFFVYGVFVQLMFGLPGQFGAGFRLPRTGGFTFTW